MSSDHNPQEANDLEAAPPSGEPIPAEPEISGAPAPSIQQEPAPSVHKPHDFQAPTLLSPRDLFKLRAHQEEFVAALEARLSLFLRLDLSLKLANLQTVPCKTWMAGWAKPSCLTLFKLEPLRGVCVLEIPPNLALGLVDRLLGGPGQAPESIGEISEIERALLEQIVQIVLGEWSRNWSKVKELKPVLLGYESDGKFIQIAPDLTLLVLAVEIRRGESTESFQIGIPFIGLAPLIAEISGGTDLNPEPDAPVPANAAVQWNAWFDEVPVPVTVECHGLELTARAILNLKVGDLLPLDSLAEGRVKLRVGDANKFNAHLGTVDQRLAAQITAASNS